jgi:UDP-N-acetylmuramate dehydrogenase
MTNLEYYKLMYIRKNVSLARYSTMRLGGEAKYLTTIKDKSDIPHVLDWAAERKLPVIMIGGGSNLIWSDSGFDGLVIVNKIIGYKVEKEDHEHSFVTIGSGEDWDKAVAKTVADGLHGIEALSLIPGTTGATPVQNVGAYGQEIADTLISVEAYDSHSKKFVIIPEDQCGFGYRTSRFKTTDKGRFYITALCFRLYHKNPKPPFYPSLQTYIDTMNIKKFTPRIIREIVIAVRSSKLPDPKTVANNGSFFANPIISNAKFSALHKKYPHIPHWELKDGKVKLSAAWLLEHAGFKNFHDVKTGMATWHKQPLVLVNEKAESTSDLLHFRNRIIKDVHTKFGIELEQEPELVEASKY